MSNAKQFLALRVAVLTVSDSRTLENDSSGQYLAESLGEAGHVLADRALLKDDVYQLRAKISAWIANPAVQVVLISGGTGLTGRDITPEAVRPLLDKEIDGFGELFRHISYQEIGSSTIQSRAFAGLANGTLIFGLPGSTGACRTAWEGIVRAQIDARHGPCNFATLLPRFTER